MHKRSSSKILIFESCDARPCSRNGLSCYHDAILSAGFSRIIPRVNLPTESAWSKRPDPLRLKRPLSKDATGYLIPTHASGACLANQELDNKRALGLAEAVEEAIITLRYYPLILPLPLHWRHSASLVAITGVHDATAAAVEMRSSAGEADKMASWREVFQRHINKVGRSTTND